MTVEIKTLVFPTDFSEFSAAALPWARKLADDLDAAIHCVYVIDEPHIYSTLDLGPVTLPTLPELVESAKKRLNEFVKERLQGLSHATVAQILIGRPADEIVAYARDADAAMIVITTHGYSGVKQMLLGSTTEEVLRHADCPIMAVRTTV